jgi:preprotein translocase subunit YajC
MELQPGDYVKTQSGDIGKVVQVSRLTVFVAFPVPGRADLVQAYLASQLTKIERPKS